MFHFAVYVITSLVNTSQMISYLQSLIMQHITFFSKHTIHGAGVAQEVVIHSGEDRWSDPWLSQSTCPVLGEDL